MNPVNTENRKEDPAHREQWKRRRAAMEWNDYIAWRRGTHGYWLYKYKHKAILVFGALLKAVGFFKYGYRNALELRVRHVDIFPKGLPEAFKGYRILHLSDLHLDSIEGLGERIARTIEPLSYDLCVITGDFRYTRHGEYKQVLPDLRRILSAVTATDGIYAVLGNHDTEAISEDLEALGPRLLTNESLPLARGGQHIRLIGTDDPHDYYTDTAASCLKNSGEGFKLLLVHSAEMYRLAAANGVGLYLCGHSHGGQICLPGGWPLMTYLNTGKRFYKGLWHYKDMTGYTSSGCGTAKIPVRFNCSPEIPVLTLR